MRAPTRGTPAIPRPSLLVPMLLASAMLIAGCGIAVDTSRTASARETVPLRQGDTSEQADVPEGPVKEAALAPDRLRTVDPCKLLTKDLLSRFGKPEDNRASNFEQCANYMTDQQGRKLNISLTLGESLSGSPADKATTSVAGLPVIQDKLDDDPTVCFVTVITSTSPPAGIKAHISTENKPCQVGLQVDEAVISTLRSNPPQYDRGKTSLVGLDPCTLVDGKVVTEVLGKQPERSESRGLHSCDWDADSRSLDVRFKRGIPAEPRESDSDPPKEVDLDGVRAFEEARIDEGSSATCELEWTHRSSEDVSDNETVRIKYSNYDDPKGVKPCAKARTAGQALLPKLPET